MNSDPLTYKWTLITVPSGSTAQLSNPTIVKPTFVADKAGTYVAQLIVNDGKIDSPPSTVTIITSTPSIAAPTANAGANQTVVHGTTVTLDGSGSTDPQNLPLTYTWSFTSKPAGSTAVLSNTAIAKPTFVADKPGSYVLQLIVSNGTLPSVPATVTITTTNTPPVANPGANQNVTAGSLVNLNGGGSTDADNDPLTYLWSFTSIPSGSTAALSAATSKTPTFVADIAGPYVVQLIVNDGFASSAPKTVTITATAAPGAPTANAGANQTVAHGATVTLDGSGSTDPQNLPLTYTWSFTSKPAGSTAALSNTAIAKPTFVADKPGSYILQLIVSNGTLPSAPATVTITATNTPPVANPGVDQTVTAGSVVNLNGGGSTDADNDPLTYLWSFSSVPNGSSAALSSATSKTPTFVADVAGTYVVQLIVNDGFASSDPKTVTITASAATADIIVPATLTIAPGQTMPYNVALAQPAATDITVQLQNSDFTKATLSMSSVLISAGQKEPTRLAFITGVASGDLTIKATAPNLQPATTNVTVGLTATLTPANLTISGPSTDGSPAAKILFAALSTS